MESGVNVKVVQEMLGHKDVSTTLDIYTDVTKELARREFEGLDEKLKENMESAGSNYFYGEICVNVI